MTTRRYYTDAYTTRFQARIVERLVLNDQPAVVLEETFFYPTSGGQPFDIGRLGGAQVVGVEVRATDGAVIHRISAPVPDPVVEAQVDWERRFDHMQQHTAQHVLSQAFLRVANAATIGFHLGDQYVSIDLDSTSLAEAAILGSFALANHIVESNVPVRAWFPSPDELKTIALRKTPEVDGPLRIVAIGDFDLSACGGTHVATTGEIGLIHHLRTEKIKKGTKISFLAGRRAREDYRRKHSTLSAVAQDLTCSVEEVPDAVAKLRETLQQAERQLAAHREASLDAEAEALRATATAKGEARVVQKGWNDRPLEEVRGLVLRLTSTPGVIALLGVAGEKSALIFGRSENLPHNMNAALQAAFGALGGGRGGGSRIAQGGGAPATLAQLDQAFEAALATL